MKAENVDQNTCQFGWLTSVAQSTRKGMVGMQVLKELLLNSLIVIVHGCEW